MPQPFDPAAASGPQFADVQAYLDYFLGQPMPLSNGATAPSFFDYLRQVRRLDPAAFSQTALEVIALSIELSMYSQMLTGGGRAVPQDGESEAGAGTSPAAD